MLFGDDEYKTRSILSLEEAIEGTKTISIEESRQNIIDNLVIVAAFEDGIVKNNGYEQMTTRNMKTGFRLTSDGWILVPYSSVSEYEPEWKLKNTAFPKRQEDVVDWLQQSVREYAVIDTNKISYPIDTSFILKMPRWNLALIKSVMAGPSEAVKFRADSFIEVNNEIEMVGIHNQEIYQKSGMIYADKCKAKFKDEMFCEDAMLTTIKGKDEHGVFVTNKGEFAGLAQFSVESHPLMANWIGGMDYLRIYAFLKDAVGGLKINYCKESKFFNN